MNKTIEHHPFEAFIPENIQFLIVGSFPGKEQTNGLRGEEDWFYGAPRNQFWRILEFASGIELKTKDEKRAFFENNGIGITDIIRSCVRLNGTNLDENLQIAEYNKEVIGNVLRDYQPKVLFTSRFVEKIFKQLFPDYKNTDILPSPSPRYFRIRVAQKAEIYKKKLHLDVK